MALPQYDPAKHLAYLNKVRLADWGESDPIKSKPLRDKGTLKQGFGTAAVSSSIECPGALLTLNIMPGSPTGKKISKMIATGVPFEFMLQVIATGEEWVYTEGVYNTREELVRAGEKPSDDGFNFMFNRTVESFGEE